MKVLAEQVNRLFAPWDRPDSPGVSLAVVQDGQIVHSRGYGMADLERGVPLTPQSVFDIASTSKQFTACCVLLLANEGRLALDDDIRTFFPQMPDFGRPITVRHLLHHTSGIRDYLELLQMAGLSWEYDYFEQEILDLLFRQKSLNFPPGEEHLYSNSGYFLLGEIVRRVSGQTLGRFAQEHIFAPLGMASTRFYDDFTAIVPRRAIGYTARPEGGYATALYKSDLVGDGGVLTTVEDLARWDQNFYANRLGGGAGLIEQLLTVGRLNDGRELDYAGGLVRGRHHGLAEVSHSGGWAGYRAELIRYPAQRLSVICLANLDTVDCTALARQVARLYLAGSLEPGGEPAAMSLSAEELAAHAGCYRDQAGTVARVRVAEGELVIHHPQGRDYTLYPLAPGRFHTTEASPDSLEVFFEAAAAGQPQRMRLVPEHGAAATWEETAAPVPDAALLTEYVGTYRSAELAATYRLAVRDGALWLEIGYTPAVPLEMIGPDRWAGRESTLCFRRGRAGQVRGLEVRTGRARGVWFRKTRGRAEEGR